jgi:hypothetical protein
MIPSEMPGNRVRIMLEDPDGMRPCNDVHLLMPRLRSLL